MNSTLQFYGYHTWSNNRIFSHLKELPNDIYTQEIQSVFPSISDVIVHIFLTDVTWFGVISGDSFEEITENVTEMREKTNGKSMEEMEKMYTQLTKKYHAFFAAHEDLNCPMSVEHPHFGKLNTHLSELVQHVVNHGTYHRGNITAMLRQLGHKGASTDYVFYLYEQRQ
ncbi:DinB family protein [Neobacillus sp. NPDC093182]|uniref:DinB family protein n=1 Tax=Neobacillus sp. NPDC093182 TaxID=3364297 RepID=UPI00381E084A